MTENDRLIYEECKMDCFNCKFKDCMLSTQVVEEPKNTIKRRKYTKEDDKKIMQLRAEGKSYKEISEIMNMPEGTVSFRLTKINKEEK